MPTLVLTIRMSELNIKKRALSRNDKVSYDYDIQVLHQRLETTRNNLVEV